MSHNQLYEYERTEDLRGQAFVIFRSFLPVFSLMGREAFIPSNEAIKSSVPHSSWNILTMPGWLNCQHLFAHDKKSPTS